ncbi:MAG: TetR/AcrR family transcriptional regulator [Capsulimonadaceae bacterium]|nr:TetR/AcrR family transcriptional regulator [Capsulimonadaceae bacterium]
MHVKREDQRENLLEAAYDLVGEVGVSGLRTRDIAERAGVNIATLHYCFENKDALLQELYGYILREVRQDRERCLAGVDGASAILRAHADLRFHFLSTRPASVRAWRAFAEGAWTSDVVRRIMRQHLSELRERLASTIAQGRADGTVTGFPDVSDELAASMLMSLFDGMMLQWVANPDGFPVQEYQNAVLSWLGIEKDDREESK